MRGPRVRVGGASLLLELVDGSAGLLASAGGTESEAASPPFADVEVSGRFRPGRLRGRTVSPST